ncbi:MAG: putative transport system permease protein [Pseudomonadota bacterium]|nr:putative transport system permease protein [Pseudomonadota bacterium]MDQ5904667.1 putative transport system permease protein [Pseudomonadota bacterium]MDQ5915060.1 putative transport system permease protein [Pseudomonadota bacterium]MDQ5917232.1 putative transport system permease protein [Pseudomonadota bacterium]
MIRPADTLHLALRAITAHRLRSFLTLLGIAVGIAAVILLTSIGEGIHRFVLAEFTQFGTNVIGIGPGKTKTSGPHPSGIPTSVRPLTLDDADSLKQLPHVTAVTPTVWGNIEVGANGRLRRTTAYGVSSAMTQVFSIKVKSGQFLPPDDSDNARPFVVLGAKLKNELFGSENPLGAKLKIGAMQFRIIGVLETKGQFLGIDLDDTAYIPAARALELFNREGLMEIHVSYAEGVPAAQVSAVIKQTLTARHGREDFTITTQEDMLRTLSKILDILTMAVGALGSISLLVGGVGIVTIMTIAVTERTGEIGLLVALGAPRRTILGLFLGEAVALSALGGLMGLALGIGLAQLIHLALPALPVHTPISFVLMAEGVAITIGLLAGVLPARRAAGLDAVDALRAE